LLPSVTNLRDPPDEKASLERLGTDPLAIAHDCLARHVFGFVLVSEPLQKLVVWHDVVEDDPPL